jgi:hypothetical protein
MAGFNLANYEPVEDRLARFWADHPDGRVLTELVPAPEGQWIVRSEIWKDGTTDRPDATGYAHEHVTDRGVNSTSALENCETSSVGRALANLGYAPKGARPSREEMQKAQRREADPLASVKAEVWAAAQKAGIADAAALAAHYAEVMDGRSLNVAGEPELREYLGHLTEAAA